eukprot:UN17494
MQFSGFKFWLLVGYQPLKWKYMKSTQKIDMNDLLKIPNFRWVVIFPQTSIHVPKDHSHFVIKP